jgi:hypothetical protein
MIDIIPIEQMWSSVWEVNTAGTIGNTLAQVYPGYQWWVRADAQAGYFVIQCSEINASLNTNQPWGMVMHVSKIDDHGLLRKKIVRMGGELLERASLIRGKSRENQQVKRLDGIPEAMQPMRQTKIVLAA